ncbi:MAG: VOC family protein [Novosphingobium sp.]|nr:VOC family protein [Novosphingobium sp.]
MPQLLTRPPVAHDPAAGVLMAEHFQVAYATNDIDRACAIFTEQLGIREFRSLEGELPAGGHIRIELAWVGTVMYELMIASGPGSQITMSRLPQGGGFALKHHHLGYLIHDQAQWDALLAEAERKGFAVPHLNDTPGFIRSCFVDVPVLGHYLEYLFPEPAGMAFFDSVPRH